MARYKIVLTSNEEHRFECDDGEPLLDAAEAAGIADLPWGCRSGVCGSCVARLLSGEVEQESQMALDDERVAAGYVVMCTATPCSDVEVVYEDRD